MLLQPSKLSTTSVNVKSKVVNGNQDKESTQSTDRSLSNKERSENSIDKLVGRPLVPFFDDDDQLNCSLTPKDSVYEDMEVDARVWNSEGYFEYPEEQKAKSNSTPILCMPQNQPDRSQTAGHKTPGALLLELITRTPMDQPSSRFSETASTTAGADLLTPQSIASCALQLCKHDHSERHVAESTAISNTTVKIVTNKPKMAKKTNHRGIMEYKSESLQQTNKKGKKTSTQSPAQKSRQASCPQNVNNRKSKTKKAEALPSKWAWSAFQSSPDPKSLPIPTLNPLAQPSGFSSVDADDETLVSLQDDVTIPGSPSSPPVTSHPPHVAVPLNPPVPPPPTTSTKPAPGSIEQNMTQDLRRMLNIG